MLRNLLTVKKLVAVITVAIAALTVATAVYGPIQQSNLNINSFSATANDNSSTLYLSPGPTPAFTDNFNPFDGVWLTPAGIMGLIYEPLLQINTYNGTVIPWLATGYSWNANATVLTMYLRHGVEFSNGLPFNASDVVYTFNEQKALFGEWGVIKNITAVNPYEVNFTFTSPNTEYLFYIGSNIVIPEQLFANSTDPLKEIVTDPIGTGPYVLQSFSPQKIVLTANPNYWQKGEPKIKTVVYVEYTSNSALTLAMQSGQVQWASVFAPNITTLFVSKDPQYNHYWFPQGQPVTLLLNDLVYPLNMSFFRQAISVAINRTAIMNIGEYGYEQPANAAGLLYQQLGELNSTNLALANKLATFNLSYAKQILADHGFIINATTGRLTAPNGTPVPTLNLMSVAGYSDWDTDIALIANELNQLGLTVNLETPTQNTVSQDVTDGQYQMALYVDTGIGPNAWYDYSGLDGSVVKAPSPAYVNPERWNATGTGFMQYFKNFTALTNTTQQDVYINKMASIMLQQMPIVYVVYSADWYEYVNSTIGGWPNAQNPFWIPMPWYPGPNEVVILHLYPKGGNAANSVNPVIYDVAAVVAVVVIVAAVAAVYIRNRRIRGQ